MAYPHLQGARPLSTYRRTGVEYGATAGFDGPWSWDSWVADWMDGQPLPMRIDDAAGRSEGIRPTATWCVYRPGTRYGAWTRQRERGREAMWFFWSSDEAPAFMGDRGWAVIADPERRIAALARDLHALRTAGGAAEAVAADGRLLAILGEFAAATARGGDGGFMAPWVACAPGTAPAEALLRAVDAAVASRLARPPSCAELARLLGMSPSSLAHRLKDEAGTTPMARVRWLRVRAAQELLAQPDGSVKDAARRLGFRSQFHFSRVFRQATGLSPIDYRRRMLGE